MSASINITRATNRRRAENKEFVKFGERSDMLFGLEIFTVNFYTVPTALKGVMLSDRVYVSACVRTFVCHEMYDCVPRINGWTYKRLFCAHVYVAKSYVRQSIFIQILNSLNFIFKVKDSNRVFDLENESHYVDHLADTDECALSTCIWMQKKVTLIGPVVCSRYIIVHFVAGRTDERTYIDTAS